MIEHGDEGEIADDGVFILEVVVKAQALPRKMLTDHRHPKVRAILAAILLGRGETPVPGGVGPLTVTMLLENTLTAAKNQSASAAMAT